MLIPPINASADGVSGGELTVTDTLVSVGDIRLHFRIIEGGSPNILLESGGGFDLTEWNDIAPRIARETGATVISYSRAGFGESDLPEAPCDMEIEVEWLWDALGQLDLDSDLILVGHSYGGWMVRLEASTYPDAVRGIVFVDPFSAEFVDILGVEYLDNHPMAGKLPFDTSDPSALTKYQRALVRMVGNGLAPKMEIMKETAVPEGIPVVIIRSGLRTLPKVEEQEAWDTALQRMAASIGGAVMMVAEKSNHMINLHQPEIIIEAVKKTIGKSALLPDS
jgi:pimeloyl-ACP methyl ester carboxylesterase